jgi:hypothetical protein
MYPMPPYPSKIGYIRSLDSRDFGHPCFMLGWYGGFDNDGSLRVSGKYREELCFLAMKQGVLLLSVH